MINDCLLSIIIPVYNVELYLHDCLSSIIQQRKNYIEIILIDDGSVDSSGTICDEYSLNYPFIKVLHQSNSGLSATRNKGIKEAKGKYVWYVDSDDELYEGAFEQIEDILLNSDVDIISFPYFVISGEKKHVLGNRNRPSAYVEMNTLEYLKKYKIYISACFQIIKRSVIENISFIEGVLHEDHDFTLKLYCYAKNIIYINTPLYLYFVRSNESITSNINIGHYKKRIDSLLILLQDLLVHFSGKKNKREKEYYIRHYIDNHINYILRLLYIAPLSYQEKINYLNKMDSYPIFRMNRSPRFLPIKYYIFDILSRIRFLYKLMLLIKNV